MRDVWVVLNRLELCQGDSVFFYRGFLETLVSPQVSGAGACVVGLDGASAMTKDSSRLVRRGAPFRSGTPRAIVLNV